MMSMWPIVLLWQTVVYIPEATQAQKDAAVAANATEMATRVKDGKVFDAVSDAKADIDAALLRIAPGAKKLVIVMGANWCHDSTSLAARMGSPRFQTLLRDRYEIVYVDVGVPQTGKGRNIDIAKRFGIKKMKNTPLIMVISAQGRLLNSKKDAVSWRNAASRSDDDVYRYFAEFTPV